MLWRAGVAVGNRGKASSAKEDRCDFDKSLMGAGSVTVGGSGLHKRGTGGS